MSRGSRPSWRPSSSASARDTVAAFCAETVVGAATGCVTALPGYFPAIRAVCDRHGALLILDEVMCGMGRTGTLHAWEQEGVAPDIQASRRASAAAMRRSAASSRPAGSSRRCATAPAGSCTARPTRRTRSPARRRWRCSASCASSALVPNVARQGDTLERHADGPLRQPPPCRRHPGPRPVPRAGVRGRPVRGRTPFDARCGHRRTGQAGGAGPRAWRSIPARHGRWGRRRPCHRGAALYRETRPTSPRSSAGWARRWTRSSRPDQVL